MLIKYTAMCFQNFKFFKVLSVLLAILLAYYSRFSFDLLHFCPSEQTLLQALINKFNKWIVMHLCVGRKYDESKNNTRFRVSRRHCSPSYMTWLEQSRRFGETGKSLKRHGSRSSQRGTKFNCTCFTPLRQIYLR